MTHDGKRDGTSLLSAALDVLEGIAAGCRMQRQGYQEFLRFLRSAERPCRPAS